jgi:hypothetical protein
MPPIQLVFHIWTLTSHQRVGPPTQPCSTRRCPNLTTRQPSRRPLIATAARLLRGVALSPASAVHEAPLRRCRPPIDRRGGDRQQDTAFSATNASSIHGPCSYLSPPPRGAIGVTHRRRVHPERGGAAHTTPGGEWWWRGERRVVGDGDYVCVDLGAGTHRRRLMSGVQLFPLSPAPLPQHNSAG